MHGVGTSVENLSQQPQIARIGVPGVAVVLAVDALGDHADRRRVLGRDENVGHGCDGLIHPAGLVAAVARTSVGGNQPRADQRVGVGQRPDVLGQRVAQRSVQQVRSSDIEVGLVLGRRSPAGGDGVERDHDHALGSQP